jgi:hypothetical protein
MKHLLLRITLLAAVAMIALGAAPVTSQAGLSGTKAVGPTGDYASLTAAFAAINADVLSGALILELQSAYVSTVETFPLVAGAFPGSSSSYTVTVRPEAAATGLAITSNNATGTFDLNGATYVIIDGRPGGSGTSKELTIENTATGSTGAVVGWALRFVNDARFNMVTYVTAKNVHTSAATGVVCFSTTSGTNGNDSNTIEYCDLRDGATTPTNIIYSLGTTTTNAHYNSGNTIANCNIFNFFSATGNHTGIMMSNGNTDWTIQGNSFYQTAARNVTGTGTIEFNAITSTSSNNNNVQVLGNYVGGSAPQCGGGAMTYTGNATVRALRLTAGNTTPTSLQGNTFQNISVSSSSASSSQMLIGLVTGSFNVGNVTPNVIGSQSTTGNIAFALSNTSTAAFSAINAGTGTPGTIVISNNTIGGISVTGVSGVGTATVRGISIGNAGGGTGTYTVSNNTIGSASVANSFTGSTNNSMAGIFGSTTSSYNIVATITGNTIANLAYLGTGSSAYQLFGISATSAGSGTATYTITGNTVRDLSSASTSTSTGSSASVIGISMTTTSVGGQSVSQNVVHSLSNTASTAATCVTGIHYGGPTSGTNTVARNSVHSLTLSTSGFNTLNAPQITGININGGNTAYLNNMVRLGFDAAGNALTAGYPITGIYENVGTDNLFGNSVYIGGSGVVANQNTFAFQTSVTFNTRSYKDNILVNARSNSSGSAKNYAIRIPSGTMPLAGMTCDYNDLYVSGTGGVLGGVGAGALITDYNTLPAWVAATTFDPNSKSADPQFVNPTGGAATGDLHIITSLFPPSPVADAGTSLALLADDFDGNGRGLFPDIGADEFLNYTIVATAGPNGSISPVGSILVNAGTNLGFTITPDSCYDIADVEVDDLSQGPIAGYSFTNIQASHTIAASFAITTYTLTSGVVGGGSLLVVPDQPAYDCGTSVEITANAGSGWQFDQWTGDAGGSDNPLTVIMDADKTITAVFIDIAPPEVQLTAPNGGEVWNVGDTDTVTWTATDNAGVTAIDLEYSTDGGVTYPYVIATGLANTGSYGWLVPDTRTTTARVRATARDAADNSAADASDADFEIYNPLAGVAATLLGDHRPMGIYPSPAFAGEAHVLYRARSAGIVDVAVYDVSGRLVRQLESGYVTVGVHDLKWDGLDERGTAVSGGIYFVRFVSASGTHVTERLAIVR